MQPKLIADPTAINPALAPQGERSQFAPRRIDPPQQKQKKQVKATLTQEQQFSKKISVWQAWRKVYSVKQCCQQIMETDMFFCGMSLRIAFEYTALLAIACYASPVVMVAMIFIYTALALITAFDRSWKLILIIRLLSFNVQPGSQVVRNWFMLLELFYFAGLSVFGVGLCYNVAETHTLLEFFEDYKSTWGVFAELVLLYNVFLLLTHFVHKKNLRFPHQMAYTENFFIGKKILSLGSFANATTFEREPFDIETAVRTDLPEAKRRDGMDYNE